MSTTQMMSPPETPEKPSAGTRRSRRQRWRFDAIVLGSVLAFLVATGTVVHRVADDPQAMLRADAVRMEFDFEDGPGDGTEPEGFMVAGAHAGFEVRAVEDRARSGQWSTRIALVDERGLNSFGTVTKCMPADRFRGTRIRYTGHVAGEDVHADTAGPWIRSDDAAGDTLTFDNMRGRAFAGSSDFREMEVILDVPGEAAELCFGVLLAGAGTLWVDDLVIETVAPFGQGPELTAHVSDELTNLGFEDGAWPGGTPAGWQLYGEPAYSVEMTGDAAHSEATGVRMRHLRTLRDDQAGFLSQCDERAADLVGRTVVVSTWLRIIEAGQGTVELQLAANAGDSTGSLAEADPVTIELSRPTGWAQHQIRVTMPEGATEVCTAVQLRGTGGFDVDGFTVDIEG